MTSTTLHMHINVILCTLILKFNLIYIYKDLISVFENLSFYIFYNLNTLEQMTIIFNIIYFEIVMQNSQHILVFDEYIKQIVDPGCYDIVYKKQTISSTTIAMPNKTIRSDQSKNRYKLIEILIAFTLNFTLFACQMFGQLAELKKIQMLKLHLLVQFRKMQIIVAVVVAVVIVICIAITVIGVILSKSKSYKNYFFMNCSLQKVL